MDLLIEMLKPSIILKSCSVFRKMTFNAEVDVKDTFTGDIYRAALHQLPRRLVCRNIVLVLFGDDLTTGTRNVSRVYVGNPVDVYID